MAFVPGFDHDVFISYAHGDDRDWINRFLDRLRPDLSRLLPEVDVWIDKDDLRKSRDFEKDIPRNLEKSAVLISLVSPIYVTRPYCVQHECRRFVQLASARKQPGQRFDAPEFNADLFGFRCPILPIEGRAYWNDLIPGATDLPFCDDLQTFAIASPSFEAAFRDLLRQLRDLLRRMRNQSTPVLLYPRNPDPELAEAHSVLRGELNAQSYRVLPEDELDPIRHARSCDLGVLLLGARYNATTRRLVDSLRTAAKQFVVWPSPAVEMNGEPVQRGFYQELLHLEAPGKTLLSSSITPEKLKQEVIALLKPQAKMSPAPGDKPRVYLIYDSTRSREKDNAGRIAYHYADDFHFEYSDDPGRNNVRITQSDGVLMVWGDAKEEWSGPKFEQMIRLSCKTKSRGLCLFDPKEDKHSLAQQILTTYAGPEIHIAEQFGAFDATRLEPFFTPIRRGAP